MEVFFRILQYLINLDLVVEQLSASSTCGEHKDVEACEDSADWLCLPPSDVTDRLSADQGEEMRTGQNGIVLYIFCTTVQLL